MLLRRLELVLLFAIASFRFAASAKADDMALTLSRLSEGDCAATLGGATPVVLSRDGLPTLRRDQEAFRQLATQLSAVVAPVELSPVTTTGPIGLDVALQTTLTRVEDKASYWARATRGDAERPTCDGGNGAVRPLLASERVRVEKGLPLGFTVGALVGVVHASGFYLIGADLKLAILEDVSRSRVPDLAVRVAVTRVVGAGALELTMGTLSGIASERYVLREYELSPFLGADVTWTRAESGTVDLTPNIDAHACRAGVDPLCQAASATGSSEDFAHDVRFAAVSLLRSRAFAGLALRYRRASLSSTIAADLVPPRRGDYGRGAANARQWTVSVAPGVSF